MPPIARLLAASAALSLAPAATTAVAAPSRTGPVVALERCAPGLTAQESGARFVPRVTASGVAGVRSYGFRLRLQRRSLAGGSWRTLPRRHMPDRGRLVVARPGAVALERRIDVEGLEPGHRYRLRVTGLWRTPSGTRTLTRVSRSCRVPDRRLGIAVDADRIGWIPGVDGGRVVYVVPLAIRGAAAWTGEEVPVEVRQGGTLLGRMTFDPATGPDAVRVPGARCDADRPVTVTIGVADELVRDADGLSARVDCAAASR
ncbi:MAG: hypothetical protein M0P31_03295 [Solirubrobacteraceae bacterium]|nr:hypothetical protein [Solirubrobacteraceae bacterium]